MEKVTGIGGFFFVARDPGALGDWYAQVLGIDPVPASYDEPAWEQQGGVTIFEPFAAADPDAPPFTLNFRVRDLDAMVTQVRASGRDVEVDPASYPNGRFASTSDPEGNPIQLWEPA
jgi:glyoxylase I family protein